MEAYGFAKNMTESEIVAELFKLYEKLTEGKWLEQSDLLIAKAAH